MEDLTTIKNNVPQMQMESSKFGTRSVGDAHARKLLKCGMEKCVWLAQQEVTLIRWRITVSSASMEPEKMISALDVLNLYEKWLLIDQIIMTS